MFEFLLGLFITALANGIFATRGDPERHQQYWREEPTDIHWKIDSTILVALDSTHFDYLDEEYIDEVILIPRTKADSARAGMIKQDSLQLDGL